MSFWLKKNAGFIDQNVNHYTMHEQTFQVFRAQSHPTRNASCSAKTRLLLSLLTGQYKKIKCSYRGFIESTLFQDLHPIAHSLIEDRWL